AEPVRTNSLDPRIDPRPTSTRAVAGGRLRRDGEGRLGARSREAAGADLEAVRTGDPVDVDRAGPGVAAPGHLRRAEVTAAGPCDPAAPVGDRRRGRQFESVSL